MRMTNLLLVTMLALPTRAFADDRKEEAKQHRELAATAYKEARYEDVLAELNKAQALDPKPDMNYAIGQVYAKLGRCSEATSSYEQYLASNPRPDRAQIAREAIASCKDKPAPPPTTPEPVEPAPAQLKPVVPQADDPVPPPPVVQVDTSRHWYKDPIGVGLVGGGAVALLVSAITYSSARGDVSAAEQAATYGEQVDLFDKARGKRTISVVFLVAGLAAGGAGTYYYVRRSRDEQGVAVVPAHGGGLVTWTTGF